MYPSLVLLVRTPARDGMSFMLLRQKKALLSRLSAYHAQILSERTVAVNSQEKYKQDALMLLDESRGDEENLKLWGSRSVCLFVFLLD